jgi:hypothetical protein
MCAVCPVEVVLSLPIPLPIVPLPRLVFALSLSRTPEEVEGLVGVFLDETTSSETNDLTPPEIDRGEDTFVGVER